MGAGLEAIAALVRDGDEKATVQLVRQALAEGLDPQAILARGLVPGLQQLGELFKNGEAFLPEIFISVRAFRAGLREVPELDQRAQEQKATVVLGSVEGDLHDIGRNLVGMMLQGNGFKIVDLGGDVATDVFVRAVEDTRAHIVAMSSLLTSTLPEFGRVIEALTSAGLRGGVSILVGGAPVSRALADKLGAEGFAEDCVTAVDEANRLIEEKGR